MKRFWFSTALAAVASTTAFALSASPQPATGSRSSARAGMPIALTGCLEASDEPRVFLLTNAVRNDDEASQDEGEGKTAAKKEGRTYRIVPLAAPQLDLKSHVGEQVEVGGRLVSRDELHRQASSAKDADSKDADAIKSDKPAPPTIAVTYVRKSASRCPSADKTP